MTQIVPDRSGKVGNTKQLSPCFHHMITIAATDNIDDILIRSKLSEVCDKYSFQLEKGEKTDYLHYQIYCHTKQKMRMTAFKKRFGNTIHYERVQDFDKAFAYCQKEETRQAGPWVYPPEIRVIHPNDMYPWQRNIVKMCEEEPDNRTIHWYWEPEGRTGKTTLAKYLCVKKDAVFVSGKKNDVLYAASIKDSRIYIIGYSRDKEDYVSYDALECLKDGIYFCSKYESNMVCRNPPHVIVFANFAPDITKLSKDRWNIIKL